MSQRLREVLEAQAETDSNARAVLSILRRREAGLIRQRTTAEIALQYARGEIGQPVEEVTCACGAIYVATSAAMRRAHAGHGTA